MSSVETAVLLAVVIGGALLALSTLGSEVSKTYATGGSRIAQSMGQNPRNSESSPLSEEHVNQLAQLKSAMMQERFWLRVGIAVMVLGFIGVLLYYRFRPKEKQFAIDEEALEKVRELSAQNKPIQCPQLIHKREAIFRSFTDSCITVLNNAILASHVMSPVKLCVIESMPRVKVANQMRGEGAFHALVCNENGDVCGIINECDLSKVNCATAGEMMSPAPFTLDASDDMDKVIGMLVTARLQCIPVEENGTLVGTISVTDLLVTLQCVLSLFDSMFSGTSRLAKNLKPAAIPPTPSHGNGASGSGQPVS